MRLFLQLLLALCFVVPLSLIGQLKYDYNWVIASSADGIPGIDAFVIDFNNGKRSLREISAYNMIHQENAVISDGYGNLQFFTNGCEIMDTLGEVITNGDEINPGQIYDLYCESGTYLGIQNSTILPDIYNDRGYYYLHKGAVFDEFGGNDSWLLLPTQSYSYIKSSSFEQEVFVKNEIIDSDRFRFPVCSESILHKNGKDWWSIDYTLEEEGGLRLTYLVNESGIHLYKEEEYEHQNTLKDEYGSAGQSSFSPSGQLYAQYNAFTGLDLFDFDRATGEFSNFRHFPTDLQENYSGLAFSPNSRFIYISSYDKLHQLDMWEGNLEDGFMLIGEYDGFLDPFPTNFTWMQLGPDCRIYMTSTNGVSSYHVINNPNEKGLDCDFVQHGFELPIHNGTASIPNFPVFRFDEDDVCDPTITSVFDIPVEIIHNLDIFPNPTNDLISIAFPDDLREGKLYVKSMRGQVLYQQDFDYAGSQQVSLCDYEAGIYIIEVISKSKRYVSRVVKVNSP